MMYCNKTHRHYGTFGGWWPCEERVLLSMIADGCSYDQIAEVLDRSYHAVYGKIKHIKKQRKGRR